jgi:hypothetical protein
MTVRIFDCVADTYITNKYINNSMVSQSNVGMGGTIDLFKLYDETTVPGVTEVLVETSRALLKFDLSSIISSSLVTNSFKSYLKLSNIYSGQPVPSSFSLSLFPLAKEFSEGRGMDVVSFRDTDVSNWTTASYGTIWTVSGAGFSGSVSSSNIDYYHTPSSTQFFSRGDEELLMDITPIVSGVVHGVIPNYGFRLSFSEAYERDQSTYFVKRFFSRHALEKNKVPKILFYDDNSRQDQTLSTWFGQSSSVYLYNNKINSSYRNFSSGGLDLTGSNCMKLLLISSKSITITTSSWSDSFSSSITYTTSSVAYFSSSFNVSQVSTGVYSCSFILDPNTNSNLSEFINSLGEQVFFKPVWTSQDQTLVFRTGSYYLPVNKNIGSVKEAELDEGYVVSLPNLKDNYSVSLTDTRIRVLVNKFGGLPLSNYFKVQISNQPKSTIVSNMHWRLKLPFTGEIVVDFDTIHNGTKLSSDGEGMWFVLYPEDLVVGQVYELEFLINEEINKTLILGQGFRFKIVE